MIMDIISFRDRRLQRLVTEGKARGLPPAAANKITHMITFLLLVRDEAEIEKLSHWRPHRLAGEYEGSWSLVVTRNWRLVFEVRGEKIANLDLIDYH